MMARTILLFILLVAALSEGHNYVHDNDENLLEIDATADALWNHALHVDHSIALKIQSEKERILNHRVDVDIAEKDKEESINPISVFEMATPDIVVHGPSVTSYRSSIKVPSPGNDEKDNKSGEKIQEKKKEMEVAAYMAQVVKGMYHNPSGELIPSHEKSLAPPVSQEANDDDNDANFSPTVETLLDESSNVKPDNAAYWGRTILSRQRFFGREELFGEQDKLHVSKPPNHEELISQESSSLSETETKSKYILNIPKPADFDSDNADPKNSKTDEKSSKTAKSAATSTSNMASHVKGATAQRLLKDPDDDDSDI